MAEVPEVETIVRDLREAVVGRTIRVTEVLLPAAVRFPTVDEFTTLLTERVVLESNRRAKYILLPLSGQRVLAGLGNRDTDESLWLAGIDPRRAASSLTPDELTRLHAAIGKVLTEGVALRGTQRDLFDGKGQAVHRRYIFEKSREPCPRCGTPIAYIRIGGRNTFYCPNCQH